MILHTFLFLTIWLCRHILYAAECSIALHLLFLATAPPEPLVLTVKEMQLSNDPTPLNPLIPPCPMAQLMQVFKHLYTRLKEKSVFSTNESDTALRDTGLIIYDAEQTI